MMTATLRAFLARFALGVVGAILIAPDLHAQAVTPAAPIPIASFFRADQTELVELSPDGRHAAIVLRAKGQLNMAIVDLDEPEKRKFFTELPDYGAKRVAWINNDRLLLSFGDSRSAFGDGFGFSTVYAMDRDASNAIRLTRFDGIDEIEGMYWPPQGNAVIVSGTETGRPATDLFRYDTKSLDKKRLTDTLPGKVEIWMLDRQGRLRMVLTTDRQRKRTLWHRPPDGGAWMKLAELGGVVDHSKLAVPVAFGFDGTLYAVAYNGEDKAALYAYDLANNTLGERIAAHADYSVGGGLIFDYQSLKLVGLRIEAEKPEFVWFDRDWANWHAMVDKALPGRVNTISRSGNDARILVYSYSDRDPGSWYLFDPLKRQLLPLATRKPWIKPEQMAESRFIRYPARDGLSIPAYLTLPPGKEAKALPLVVLVHGGPFVRGETWGWDAEAQFLASRGYAVLQADFRGSLGYGLKHHMSGWKQWGLAMQDDLNDGLEYLAKQGIVDPKRACIMGASYGGYAVMTGLGRDPELWRCGINLYGITDLELMVSATWSDRAWGSEIGLRFVEQQVADRKSNPAALREVSPINFVDRIKRPVLMAYGGADSRVVGEHGTRMKRQLEDRGVPVEFLWFPSEGHGIAGLENTLDLYSRIERFLGTHNGP